MHVRTDLRACAVFISMALTVPLGACRGDGSGWGLSVKRDVPPEPPPPTAPSDGEALRDTVGAQCVLSGMTGLRVRGFGLVIGLVDRGTTECPTSLREYLIDFLTKEFKLTEGTRLSNFHPQKMIDSPDTAVVEVVAIIPPGSPKGTLFDVAVNAVAGTQTRSLEGGLLIPCELKIVAPDAAAERLIAGRSVARAAGAVFTNPFSSTGASSRSDGLLRGTVLGGGRSTEPRNIRLVLKNPSYSLARRIQQRINERFGNAPKTAEALSRGHVDLRTPPKYHDDPRHFARLATHLFLYNEPSFVERKLDLLNRLIERPTAPHEDISLAWEGIGRICVRRIQRLYTHDNRSASFHAIRAGLRLRDGTALSLMGRIAADRTNPYREQAVRELAASGFPHAANHLSPLLDSENQQIRIAAYEALLKLGHPAIHSRRIQSVFGPNVVNFWLDTIESAAKPLIHVRRSGEPRIALFGANTECALPLYYSHPDGWVTLNASDPEDDITLFCRTRRTNQLSEPILVPPRVRDLLVALAELPVQDETGRPRGIGLPYSQVVQVIHALTEDRSIPAPLVMQAPTMTDLFGPDTLPDRPDADILSDDRSADRPNADATDGEEKDRDAAISRADGRWPSRTRPNPSRK